MRKVLIIIVLLVQSYSFSQLQLEKIMKGYDFIGHSPKNVFWSFDDQFIFFQWRTQEENEYSLYLYDLNKDETRKANDLEKQLSLINAKNKIDNDYILIDDNSIKKYNPKKKEFKTIIDLNSSVYDLNVYTQSGTFSFISSQQLYLYDLKNSSLKKITEFVKKNLSVKSNSTSFLENQQKELFQVLNDEKAILNNRKKLFKSHFVGDFDIENIQLNPSNQFVVFRLSKYPESKLTNVVYHVTKSGYTEQIKAREKVSINNISEHKLAYFDVNNDSLIYVDFSKLEGKINSLHHLSLIMSEISFSEDGIHGVTSIKSQDNKQRWIVLINFTNNTIETLDYQYDPAWIGGPGIEEWNFSTGTLKFIDVKNLVFQSEKTGFSHLYKINIESKKVEQLTSGNWEVREVLFTSNKNEIYIISNLSHPGIRRFSKLDPSTKKMTHILSNKGAYEVNISNSNTKLAFLYSNKTKPWELFIADNKENASEKQLTFSTTREFNELKLIEPDVVTLKASDNKDVYARLYKGKESSDKAIIFVHGAGYLQNAHHYWSSYYREFLFHQLLVEKGYTVLDIDYRASDGYGRDYRTAIYQFMGGRDLEDQIDGKKYLVENHGINPNKVGIYGGSYGGFITLMALLTKPNEFACGAALRSVTDWAHYNQEYTSNILNYPENDPQAYKKSSPIYYAENLQKPLLMLHGMVDDNVQFQDVVRLSQRFIELGKENWELAVFPVEAHGFTTTSSWLDEYKRILKLFETYVK